MEETNLTPDSTFPYRLFRFAHKRTLDSVSASYFAVISKDNNPVGLVLSVDIDERWHHAKQAATNFWQIFVREFNHSTSRSSLTRFEESLKELNKAVVKTQTKVKQTISVVAVILEGNQLHFSTIGTSRVLLHRAGKINDVTTGSTKNGNQFAAVTSGDVDTNDTLIIANQNLYEFTAAEPEDLWEGSSADELSKKILSRTQNSERALNCVLLQYSPNNSSQITLYWEESEKDYPIKLPRFSLPSLPKFSLKNINFKKLSDLIGNIKKLKLPHLRLPTALKEIRPLYLYIAIGVIVLSIIAMANSNRQNSSDIRQTEAVSIVESFKEVIPENRINFLFELAASNKLNELTVEETAELIELSKEDGLELIIPSDEISQLPQTVVATSVNEGLLYLLDETGQLWQITIDDQLKQIDHSIAIKDPVSLVAFGESSLVATDGIGNIWHYNGNSNGPTSLVLPSNLSTGKKLLAKYLDNLYIYVENSNAVYRERNFTENIKTNSSYTDLDPLSIGKVWSWTVNGDFVFLTDSQSVTGALRNKVTINPFNIFAASSTSKISSEDEVIVVSEKQLLSAYEPNGKLLWQRFYLTNGQISDISVAGETLWLSIDKKVYRQPI